MKKFEFLLLGSATLPLMAVAAACGAQQEKVEEPDFVHETLTDAEKTAFQSAAGSNLRTMGRMRLVVRAALVNNDKTLVSRFTTLAGEDATKKAAVETFKTEWTGKWGALFGTLSDGDKNVFSGENKYANGTATLAEYQALKTAFTEKAKDLLASVAKVIKALGLGDLSDDYKTYLDSANVSALQTRFNYTGALVPDSSTLNDFERFLESIVGEDTSKDQSNPTPTGNMVTVLSGLEDNAVFSKTVMSLVALLTDRMLRLVEGAEAAKVLVSTGTATAEAAKETYLALRKYDKWPASTLKTRGAALSTPVQALGPVLKNVETVLSPLFAEGGKGKSLVDTLKAKESKTDEETMLLSRLELLANLAKANSELEKLSSLVYKDGVALDYEAAVLKSVKTYADFYAKVGLSWQWALNVLLWANPAKDLVTYFTASGLADKFADKKADVEAVVAEVTKLNVAATLANFDKFKAAGDTLNLGLFNQKARALTSHLQAMLAATKK